MSESGHFGGGFVGAVPGRKIKQAFAHWELRSGSSRNLISLSESLATTCPGSAATAGPGIRALRCGSGWRERFSGVNIRSTASYAKEGELPQVSQTIIVRHASREKKPQCFDTCSTGNRPGIVLSRANGIGVDRVGPTPHLELGLALLGCARGKERRIIETAPSVSSPAASTPARSHNAVN